MPMTVISVSGQKGGISKSTIAANLSYCLSKEFGSVLLVDLDPQASLTRIVGATTTSGHMATVMGDTEPGTGEIEQIITSLSDHLAVAPSDVTLAQTELGLVLRRAREFQLHKALQPISDRYDWVIIDCPPSLGLLVSNALLASHWVIVPTELDQVSVDGIGLFMETLAGTHDDYPQCAQLMGVVAARADTRQVIQREMLDVLRQRNDLRLFNTVIPERVKFREANLMQQAIGQYAPDSAEARVIEKLTKEVIDRVNRQA
jgi:chromosome partitioning protein